MKTVSSYRREMSLIGAAPPEMQHYCANAPDIPTLPFRPDVFRSPSAGDPCCSAAGADTALCNVCRLEGIHMAIDRSEEKHIHVDLTVLESQREELQLAWHEIVAGRRPRMDALNHEISALTERANA